MMAEGKGLRKQRLLFSLNHLVACFPKYANADANEECYFI